MRARWLVVTQLIVGMSACSDSRTDAGLRDLARRMNPVLTQMRPTAQAIQNARTDDYDGIVNLCSTADDSLQVLREIEVPGQPAIMRIVGDLLDSRERVCRRNRSDWYKWCGDFCRDRWLSLINEVDHLRAEAKKANVEIVSLSQ